MGGFGRGFPSRWSCVWCPEEGQEGLGEGSRADGAVCGVWRRCRRDGRVWERVPEQVELCVVPRGGTGGFRRGFPSRWSCVQCLEEGWEGLGEGFQADGAVYSVWRRDGRVWERVPEQMEKCVVSGGTAGGTERL